jgi:DNA-binding transcriptional LysR family regulator
MLKSGLLELEAVVAIARLGSFRAAAVDLDMSPTAIGNAVASLENRLGVRLFNRTTRTVALTSAGREYVEAIAPALSDIRNAADAVADHSRKPTGTLRFSCSLAGGRQLLMPFGALYRWEFERHGETMRIDVPGSLTLDEPDMMAQASRAGLGLAYVGERMVADDIASGRLVEVLSEWTPSYPGYCLYYPGRRHMAASLRAFVDLAYEIVVRSRAKAS